MMLRITSILVLCILLIDANQLSDETKSTNWHEENVEARKTKLNPVEFLIRLLGVDNDRGIQLSSFHDLQKLSPAKIARHIVNQADWASVATISARPDTETFPAVNLISIADGPVGNGTGIPYMYLTPLDYTAQDLAKDHRVGLLVSLAQGNYCKEKEYDPMDPRCRRVMLTGKIIALKNDTKENYIVKHLFFNRHPKLVNMPASHKFFFAKLKISKIALLYTFGGQTIIPVDDYFNPPAIPTNEPKEDVSPFVYRPIV